MAADYKKFMEKRTNEPLPEPKDPSLDVPAEANTEKHIDFLDIEDPVNEGNSGDRQDQQTKERQKEWREGLEEGRRAKENE